MSNQELIDRLKQQVGKPTSTSCTVRYSDGKVEYNFGGCGIVTEVYEESERVFILVDWGVSWVVTEEDLIIMDDPG